MRNRWFVLYCAGWVIVAVLGAEAVLRNSDSPLTRLRRLVVPADAERHYALTPGVELRFEGLKERLPEPVSWRINDQGFRDERDRPAGVERGKIRVSTYGDSETFGWSVAYDETFQQRMEALDERLEVLNFGVPGYNVGNIARHIEETVPMLPPDVLIYVVHPNDFEEPLRYPRLIVESELLRRSLLFVYNLREVTRHDERRAADSIDAFREQLDRIRGFCSREGIPLIVGFLRAEDLRIAASAGGRDQRVALDLGADHGNVQLLDLEPVVSGFELVDAHLPAAAHARLAEFLYPRVVGRGDAAPAASLGSGSGR